MKEKCDRNCATCGVDNRSYCAVQMAMANQEILIKLHEKVDALVGTSGAPIQPSISGKDVEEEED